MSVSSDSVQPGKVDDLADASTGAATSQEAAAAPKSSASPSAWRGQRAVDLLAFAERTVRWEDDISQAELQLFRSLYADALSTARQELEGTASAPPARDVSEDRSALLQLRLEACDMVRRAEQAKRRARPAVKRAWRGYLLALLAFTVGAVFAGRDSLADTFDLGNVSRGKPWLASSTYANDVPVSGSLGDFSAPFFFHTGYEASPWLELDLGAETPVRSVTLVNRRDCCSNRAVPLVIETSLDHRAWSVAATRKQNFGRWRPRLDVQARWLRLRVLRESHLHLKEFVVRK